MKDASFIGALQTARVERVALNATYSKIVEKMKAKIESVKKATGLTDEAKLKVELEKDPEWNSLYARCKDAAEALKDSRKKAYGIVRERIAPKKQKSTNNTKPISK